MTGLFHFYCRNSSKLWDRSSKVVEIGIQQEVGNDDSSQAINKLGYTTQVLRSPELVVNSNVTSRIDKIRDSSSNQKYFISSLPTSKSNITHFMSCWIPFSTSFDDRSNYFDVVAFWQQKWNKPVIYNKYFWKSLKFHALKRETKPTYSSAGWVWLASSLELFCSTLQPSNKYQRSRTVASSSNSKSTNVLFSLECH